MNVNITSSSVVSPQTSDLKVGDSRPVLDISRLNPLFAVSDGSLADICVVDFMLP